MHLSNKESGYEHRLADINAELRISTQSCGFCRKLADMLGALRWSNPPGITWKVDLHGFDGVHRCRY